MVSIYVLQVLCFMKKYNMNNRYNFHLYNYNTTGSHDHVSGSTTPLYQNISLNMGIRLYNELPERIKNYTHLTVLKKSCSQYFCKMLFTLLKNIYRQHHSHCAYCEPEVNNYNYPYTLFFFFNVLF